MTTVTLGKTGITVNKNGFGALPIQRITKEEAAKLLRKAYDGGITYFDTARAYSDSEEKIGYALSDVRTISIWRQRQRQRRQKASGRISRPAFVF